MPIYEFVCHHCGNDFEKIVSFSATGVPHCPQCGSDQVQRRIGLPALHFKGSGFYINDSKKDSKSRNGAKDGEPGEGGGGESETSTESSDGDKKQKADAPASSDSPPATADKPAKSAAKSEPSTAAPTAKASTAKTER